MISVAMAVYNGEKYIEKQLDSILKQTVLPDEVIICNDCSNDKTTEILNEYLKKEVENKKVHIQIFNNEKRLGYALNFKKAIELSKGDYIFLSDQDDIWNKDKIKICIDILAVNSSILALSTGYELIDENDNIIKVAGCIKLINMFKKSYSIKQIRLSTFIKHPKYPGMAMVFKKKLWNDMIGSNIINWEYKPAHDWAINFFAALNEGMYFHKAKLVHYRQHSENSAGILSMQKKDNIYIQRINTIKGLIENVNSVNENSNIDKRTINQTLLFQRKRLELIKAKKILKLSIFEIINFKFISLQSIIGDIYALINRR